MERRVVITGMGAITPVGNDVETYWNGLKSGQNGIDEITAFDTTDFDVKLAAEVKNFVPKDYMDLKLTKRMDRYSQFAVAATKEAMQQANLDLDAIDHERFGVMVGSGIGGLSTIEAEIDKLTKRGPKRVNPLTIPMIIGNMAAGNIAIRLGFKGMCTCVVTACASSTHSIGEAFEYIKSGDVQSIRISTRPDYINKDILKMLKKSINFTLFFESHNLFSIFVANEFDI